jgi:hypothetical protein
MEYMAARMDDVITASERWREEAFEDALHAIQTNPGLSKTYAFMYNGCIYESGPSVMSLHWTKAGAYRAMNRYLFDEWEKHNHGWGRKRYSGRGTKVLDRRFEWWGIKEFPIQP